MNNDISDPVIEYRKRVDPFIEQKREVCDLTVPEPQVQIVLDACIQPDLCVIKRPGAVK